MDILVRASGRVLTHVHVVSLVSAFSSVGYDIIVRARGRAPINVVSLSVHLVVVAVKIFSGPLVDFFVRTNGNTGIKTTRTCHSHTLKANSRNRKGDTQNTNSHKSC